MELLQCLQRSRGSDRRSGLRGVRGPVSRPLFPRDGEFSDEYDLDIEKHAGGDFYDVTWITNGTVSAKGVGMEHPEVRGTGRRLAQDCRLTSC